MRNIKNLLSRYWRTIALFIGGLVVISYIALGFVYWQQGAQQKKIQDQIDKISAILFKPPAPIEQIQAEYQNISANLTPPTDAQAIQMIVDIAVKSGIDTDPAKGKFSVPPVSYSQTTVSGGKYQLMSFRNIFVQGSYDDVMAFISDIDSGTTNQSMVLRSVTLSQEEIVFGGEEGERRTEFRTVSSAISAMMKDNNLTVIPYPMSYMTGFATNYMGDDSSTNGTIEGFPDISSTVASKGYRGTGTPRNGYVLYKHDKISSDNLTFVTTSYYPGLNTKYFYTADADGKIRQFNGPDTSISQEYTTSEATGLEYVAIVNVDIYTKRSS